MTGYIQADILGKTRGLKFGMLAVENITNEMREQGVQMGDNLTAGLGTTIAWWGLYNDAFVKREPLDITFEQVSEWVDECWFDEQGQKTLSDILGCFFSSQVVTRMLEAGQESKKKASTSQPGTDGQSSSPSPSENSDSGPSSTTT